MVWRKRSDTQCHCFIQGEILLLYNPSCWQKEINWNKNTNLRVAVKEYMDTIKPLMERKINPKFWLVNSRKKARKGKNSKQHSEKKRRC